MAKVDARASLDRVRAEAAACERCDLYRRATQTVFGEGPVPASLMFVGESPGDHEDEEGHPFVGPAGNLLDRAFTDAGIDRAAVYLTNAVKHFKWKPAGKVRLHQKPNAAETAACKVWWEAELEIVNPRIVCCLGATAAQAMLGKDFRVTRRRGQFVELASGTEATATLHPSAVLRARDRDDAYTGLVRDLRIVAKRLED
jgi:uracil-DNA glycosylase family protein